MLKSAGHVLGFLLAVPHRMAYSIGRVILGEERAFRGASERLARKPGMLGLYTRQAFYRATLESCGRDVYFGFMTVLSKPAVRIGDNAYFGRFCSLGLCDIGAHTKVADGVQVLSGRHQHAKQQDGIEAGVYRRVTIGRHAWIGAGSVIMDDVGDQAVVGAGAVVVKPIPRGSRAFGVPAQPKKLRLLAA